MRTFKPLYLTAALAFALASCGGAKTMVSTPVENIDNLPLKITPLAEKDLKRWSHLDLVKDTVPGMSVDKAYAEVLKPFVKDTGLILNQLLDDNKKVLFEGAQGALLCIDHGTYPFVTSSSPSAASVPLNTGVSPSYITDVVGVTKAYSTRVGAGYFATEFEDVVSKKIREVGHEYGTTTGRARRIGWIDTVVLRHTKRISGLTGLSVMLLDVLSGIETLKLCTGYTLDGKLIDYIPASVQEYERCEPSYIELPGWTEDITKTTKYSDLPLNAQNYLATISDLVGVPIVIYSVGPDRKQTIVLKNIMN